jgi:hypothetical protein
MQMSNEPTQSSQGVLDPANRVSEVIFGLIMVLVFTGSLSIAEADGDEIRTMLRRAWPFRSELPLPIPRGSYAAIF